MCNITKIDESVQGSSGNMKGTKEGKLHIKVRQVDGSTILHTLWPVKYCEGAIANLFSLTCKLSQGSKLCSEVKNDIVDTVSSNFVLDHIIKNRDGLVDRVKFICMKTNKRAYVLQKGLILCSKQAGETKVKSDKNVNELHNELQHSLDMITWAIGKAMDLKLTGTFKTYKGDSGKVKKADVRKTAIV